MKDLINKAIGYLAGFNTEQWVWIAVAGAILIYIVYNRKQYVNLFRQAVIVSEESFNSGEGRKKLEAAINFILYRTSSLPWIARIVIIRFINKKRMVDIIEKTLQKFSDVFANSYKIDIKGNEEDGEN
ncbi:MULTISPECIES: hypothetical protein [Fusobacterium]|uniref:Uncharacterized protein n=1 Tax=Fusobacterium hwasookii ChDC F206 TaxID=1307443 RepID=A0AAC8WMG2_9FUSO|nr:hypothetical protein [Fusobacterium hwasookii]ALQ36136.1 hypothetical protein RN92_09510 [Fusobacterium hwasookii ChDC F206]ALQ37228.1 hypothetical protein RN97_03185 [Fusobacterium hwasookii ChDC F300]